MDTVAITGASGFLGRACCDAFTAAGFSVRALVRKPEACAELRAVAGGGIFHAEFPAGIDAAALNGVAAVIHCAYTTTAADAATARAVNVEGTETLRRMARQAGVKRFVFVSSLAAHAEAASLYGRTKFQLEQAFQSPGDTVVKPGTIIGAGGIFQRTREMLRRLPVIPLLYGNHALQTVWIRDAAAGIVETVRRSLDGVLVLAHPEAVSMRDFYTLVAAAGGRRPVFLPFPGGLALPILRVAERAGLRLPLTSENLLGIRNLRWFDPGPDMERLGLQPLSFRESLAQLAAVPNS